MKYLLLLVIVISLSSCKAYKSDISPIGGTIVNYNNDSKHPITYEYISSESDNPKWSGD